MGRKHGGGKAKMDRNGKMCSSVPFSSSSGGGVHSVALMPTQSGR